MIKDIKKFLKESKIERKKFLRRLSNRKNIRVLESMLSSHIFSYMHFSDDDNPVALYKLVARNKRYIDD